MSLYGCGLLVGVALIIIIPEGMVTLYEAKKNAPGGIKSEILIGMSLVFGFILMMVIDKGFELLKMKSEGVYY